MTRYSLFFLALIGLLFAACEDDEVGPVAKVNSVPVITSPSAGTSVVLTEDNADQVVAEFTWTAADFGFDAATSYALQADVAGGDFSAPISLGTANSTQITNLTVEELNTKLLANDFPGETEADLQLRVVATVNSAVAPAISETVSMKVTPYTVIIIYPQLQVPGSYQGWDPANNNTVIYSLKSDGKYEGYVFMPDPNAAFKYTDGPSWDTNWGDTDADGTLDPGGTDIFVAEAGGYKLNVDLNSLTHTNEKADWGLIGDATPTGWDSDTDMTFDSGKNAWTITIDLVPGVIKFRANDDWALNFGDDGANKILEYGGADIAVEEAGNYTIDLILSVARYTYTITKN